MGGIHSFFIESKLFQLVVEEGGNIIDEAMGEKQQNRTKETTAVPLKQSRNQVVDGPVGQPGTTAVRGALIWALM